jgi:AcrR family transcriptional regulator
MSAGATAGRPRRARDPEATRQALLDAAIELFGTHGFDGTSVQSIVERAEVTKGGFYHHFASKQALLHEIHDRFIEYHLERMRELLAEPDVPADELLRRLVRDVLVEGAARWRDDIEIFYQERRQLEGSSYAAVLAKRHEFERYVIEVLERGVAEGAFAPVEDPKVAAFGIIGMTMWTYHWFDPARGGAAEVGETYAQMLLGGLRK